MTSDIEMSTMTQPKGVSSISDDIREQKTVLQNIRENKDGIQTVLSGFVCNFVVFGIGFSYGVFQEFYGAKDGPLSKYSDSQIAIVGTFGTALTYTCGIFNKTLMYYFKPRTIMFMGATLMSLGLILAGFAHNLYQFILTQGLIYGVGSSLVYLPPVVCAPVYFNQHRAIAMGILFSGTGVGGLAIAPLTRYLIVQVGYKWTLRTLGFMNLFLTYTASMLVVEPSSASFRTNNRLFKVAQLGSWKVWLQLIGSMLQSAGYLIPLIFMSSYAQSLGFTRSQGALFIGINNAINAAFKVVFGFGGDKIGRLNMIIICSFLSAITIFALWMVETRDTFLTFIVLYGVFSGAIISLLPTCLVELFGVTNYQAMSGLMYFSRGIGNFLGSPIAGLMIANHGLKPNDFKKPMIYNGVLLVASTMCLVALWVIASIERESRSWKL